MTRDNLNVREAAYYLNVSVHTIRKWVSQRRITHTRVGDRVIFRRADLDNHLEQNLSRARY